MWLSYSDSEVNKFHPICEKALNLTLSSLKLKGDYEVIHHEYTGSLEMDFVIKNKSSGKYLCVIEVKRTPSDVNSARYQYQALSYVQNNAQKTEKPFYMLTNLESTYMFRYDKDRPKVVQQILEPGLITTGRFADFTESDFILRLSEVFTGIIKSNILDNNYEYSSSLKAFQEHMINVLNKDKEWKSSLVFLLYEYIRGVFNELHIDGFQYNIRQFKNNLSNICREAIRVNFKAIFDQEPDNYKSPYFIDNFLLEDMYKTGRTYSDGDYIADLLHEVVSSGHEHEGEVPTDLELSRFLSLLTKDISKSLSSNGKVMDPAAGSGNLITSAISVFNITPDKIKANDVNSKLLELLSLRIGLNNPTIISKETSPQITDFDVCDMDPKDFEDVEVILMNPPFVSGIYSVERKKKFYRRIKKLKTKEYPKTDIGQMGLEGPFIELINTLVNDGTTISCIIPVSYLTSRGEEGISFRQFLLEDLGLKLIFTYPSNGLFESVSKKTCVVIGKAKQKSDYIKIISAYSPLKDIDVENLHNSLNSISPSDRFEELTSGVDIRKFSYEKLSNDVTTGWRGLTSVGWQAVDFIEQNFNSNYKLTRIENLLDDKLYAKRGTAGNSGGSDLVFIDRKNDFLSHEKISFVEGIRNVKNFNEVVIESGDYLTINYEQTSSEAIEDFINEYMALPQASGRQTKKNKTFAELDNILQKDSSDMILGYKLLLPRLVRPIAKTFYLEKPAVISTNFSCFYSNSREDIKIYTSWTSTVFYQLICEINCKDQEGGRKMEMRDYSQTLFPILEHISSLNKKRVLDNFENISFKTLNNPEISETDIIWSEILFDDANYILEESLAALSFLANERNPL